MTSCFKPICLIGLSLIFIVQAYFHSKQQLYVPYKTLKIVHYFNQRCIKRCNLWTKSLFHYLNTIEINPLEREIQKCIAQLWYISINFELAFVNYSFGCGLIILEMLYLCGVKYYAAFLFYNVLCEFVSCYLWPHYIYVCL